jgi:UDP-N-acetylmuramyl tripeptide synthase
VSAARTLDAPPPVADARRLTGPNVFADRPGAVLDAVWRASAGRLPDAAAIDALAGAWRAHMTGLAGRLGWPAPAFGERRARAAGELFVSLYASAPVDQLDAAVEAAERAWAAAPAGMGAWRDEDEAAVRAAAAATRRPELAALLAAAAARGLVATWDDDAVSVGVGGGSRTWPAGALPAPDAVDWAAVRDAPVLLVTGSNGKTTTVRLAAAVLRAAGHTTGTSSTEGVRVHGPGAEPVALAEGDWAGPGGARLVLRDPRVTAAVLETARGGLLRRGLSVGRADVAVVTNIAADHYGDYGVYDLEALADAKLVVARALGPTRGLLVLSADDPTLAARAERLADEPFRVCWTQSDEGDAAAAALVAAHAAGGGRACAVRGGVLRWHDGAAWADVVRVAEAPITAGGAARHNVANLASAAAAALALGTPLEAVRGALRAFGAAPGDNPGRLERVRVGDVTALVDYAHNPAGLTALLDAARALPAARRLLVLGQAGDRDDQALGDLARAAWSHGAGDGPAGRTIEHVVLKEVDAMRRGRAPGAIPAVLRAALREAGAPDAAVTGAPDESDAVRDALAWARAGDLLVLPLHEARAALVAWLRALDAAGWRAGSPPPRPPDPVA